MTYVVTGGTGFIGRHLLRELDRRGRPIHVLVRPQSAGKLAALGLANARPLPGDITRENLGVAPDDLAALVGYEGGPFNLVPVDFVARAIDHLAAVPGGDGQTYHVVDPDPLSFGDTVNELCRAAHAPQFTLRVDRRAFGLLPRDLAGGLASLKVVRALRQQLLAGVRIPEAALSYVNNRARFGAGRAHASLAGSGIDCPPLR